jgi:hypothetical protein
MDLFIGGGFGEVGTAVVAGFLGEGRGGGSRILERKGGRVWWPGDNWRPML